jgi:hypothetical protein
LALTLPTPPTSPSTRRSVSSCLPHTHALITSTDTIKIVEAETAPSGMMARGHYNAVSKFVDDDEQTHLKFEWSFDIKKDW